MLKKKFDSAVWKARVQALTITSALYSFAPITSHADINTNSVTIVGGNGDPSTMFGSVIGLVLGLIQFVGIIMIILGIIQFIQSSHDDQVDKRIKAVTVAGSGAILVGLRIFLQQMNIIG